VEEGVINNPLLRVMVEEDTANTPLRNSSKVMGSKATDTILLLLPRRATDSRNTATGTSNSREDTDSLSTAMESSREDTDSIREEEDMVNIRAATTTSRRRNGNTRRHRTLPRSIWTNMGTRPSSTTEEEDINTARAPRPHRRPGSSNSATVRPRITPSSTPTARASVAPF